MSKLVFKAADFSLYDKSISNEILGTIDAAKIANQIFDKWLREQPQFYTLSSGFDCAFTSRPMVEGVNANWKFRIVCIEEIKKECLHEMAYYNPTDIILTSMPPQYKPKGWHCYSCGLKVNAKFEAAE